MVLVDFAVDTTDDDELVEAAMLEVCLELDVLDNVTPGLVVGIVTLATVVVAPALDVFDSVLVDVGVAVVLEVFILGHKAAIIPPFLTIPSNEFEATLSSEQALLTHVAFEVKADWQSREQPLLKSESVQVAIEVSYSTKQPNDTADGDTN